MEEHNIDLTESLEEEGYRDIREKVVQYPDVFDFYKNRKNILQVSLFRLKLQNTVMEMSYKCSCIIHLFFFYALNICKPVYIILIFNSIHFSEIFIIIKFCFIYGGKSLSFLILYIIFTFQVCVRVRQSVGTHVHV